MKKIKVFTIIVVSIVVIVLFFTFEMYLPLAYKKTKKYSTYSSHFDITIYAVNTRIIKEDIARYPKYGITRDRRKIVRWTNVHEVRAKNGRVPDLKGYIDDETADSTYRSVCEQIFKNDNYYIGGLYILDKDGKFLAVEQELILDSALQYMVVYDYVR